MGRYETRFDAEPLASLPAAGPDVIRALPPTDQWVNVRTLGVKGDGKSDDTAALKAAIDAHRVLYFPSGFYQVTDTLTLQPNTVLDRPAPEHHADRPARRDQGLSRASARPRRSIEAPKGGDNIVVGLGLFTGGINARATALLWKAGAASLVDDVKIQGGHGTFLPDGSRFDPYDPYHAGDKDPRKRWDAQYHSIWVTDGGGGTFANVWSANTYRAVRLLRLGHDDARPRPAALRRAPRPRRDRPQPGRELGAARAPDRGGGGRERRRARASTSATRATSSSPTTTAIA